MAVQIPSGIPLTGADYFNLLVDRNLRRLGYQRNIIHMALDLGGRITQEELDRQLQQSSLLSQINAISIRRKWPMYFPHWIFGKAEIVIPVASYQETENLVPKEIFDLELEPKKGKWFRFSIVQLKNGNTRLVISAHHTIIDNRGMQMIADLLNVNEVKAHQLFPEQRLKVSFKEQARQFNNAQQFLMGEDQRVAGLLAGKPKPNLSSDFSIINFDEEETQRIESNAVATGARFGSGPFYIAAVARAVNVILTNRGTAGKTIWVPVPQDQRMRGKPTALLQNQISFMFYRIPHKVLHSLPATVKNVAEQMVHQVRVKMPQSYAVMMNAFRLLPFGVYNFFMKLPTKGVVTTFSFSDLGQAYSADAKVLGHRVVDVHHFPPNPVPPGFTVVFMRFNGRLRVIVGSTSQSMSKDELVKFESLLRQDLVQK